MTIDNVTVTKKGRKPLSGEAMTPAQRQSRARSRAMKQLCDGNIIEISTSGLISLLPKLISDSHNNLVKTVCNEIIARSTKQM
ncbi:MAG: hypothetical protein WC208_06325 [Gallionella sp.]|jgi:hypothetical protein